MSHPASSYPRETCVQQLFEAQATQTPLAPAVTLAQLSNSHPLATLSYQQLNERANQLAHHLLELGVGPETLIGICVERSLDMIIGLLAILKAGSAYLPLDPTHPPARLAWLLNDAQVSILLTQSTLFKQPAPPELASIPTLLYLEDDYSQYPKINPPCSTQTENLAYVMYTSGSTGQPKGVSIIHRGIVRLVKNTNYADFSPTQTFLQLAPLAFDASTLEIWGPLLNGGRLVLAPPSSLSLFELGTLLKNYQITTLWLTAGLFHQMVEDNLEGLRSLQQLLAGGEALSVPHVKKVLTQIPQCRLINGYGPTENTTFTCCYPMHSIEQIGETVPIGYPISNTQVYVLDEQLNPVSHGEIGELYIGGDGLARDYFKRPELTAERFITPPSHLVGTDLTSSKLYKTGDFVRYRPDGALEFIGRRDHQIKIRGFRIEPGEIAATLQKIPQIQQALIVPHTLGNNDVRLVAYLTISPDNQLTQPALLEQIHQFLTSQLPPYLIPATFIPLTQFPITPNGKIDRAALPIPQWQSTEIEPETPKTPLETQLQTWFKSILKLPTVGIQDNFFDLGGHSLLATQLLTQIYSHLHLDLSLSTLFAAPTISQLAKFIEDQLLKGVVNTIIPITPCSPEQTEFPLSFAQQQLWLETQLADSQPVYNEPVTLYLTGPINQEALIQSFQTLVARHPQLRAHFLKKAGQPLQIIAKTTPFHLHCQDHRSIPESTRLTLTRNLATAFAKQPFDLTTDIPIRALLVRLTENDFHLYLTLHHIIFDGISLYQILLPELFFLYKNYSQGKHCSLPTLPLQYTDFAVWQHQQQTLSHLPIQWAYWQQKLSKVENLQLPTDYPYPSKPSHQGAQWRFQFSSKLTKHLKIFSRQAGVTPYMTLLAVFNLLLYRYTSQTDITLGTVKENRQRSELAALCGLLLNPLALRINLTGNPSFQELLARVKQTVLEAYTHQDLPFSQLVAALSPQRKIIGNPLFQIMFTFDPSVTEAIDWTWDHFDIHTGTAKFDLILELEEHSQAIRGRWEYRTDLFKESTVQRWALHYQNLLEIALAAPDQKIGNFTLLTEPEISQIISWNQTITNYPLKTVHAIFEEQAQQTPQAIALRFGKHHFNYQWLNTSADHLAAHLQIKEIALETPVGICVERSVEMIIGLLAILKIGGAYVPLDPSYPIIRLQWMIKTANIKILLTQQHLQTMIKSLEETLENIPIIYLDQDWSKPLLSQAIYQTKPVGLDHLAYLMYTSGSTGQPKAVSIVHRGIVRLVKNINYVKLGPQEVHLQLAPLSFDAATFEIWGALLNGGCLVIAPPQTLSLRELEAVLQQFAITTLWLTAGLFHRLVEERPTALQGLHQLLAGGDVLSVSHVNKAVLALKKGQLINGYGPTENTTFTCCYPVLGLQPTDRSLPIGQPIANTQIFILDIQGQLVPMGVTGEVYIGGDGLAKGYYQQPELTAEKFVTVAELPGLANLVKQEIFSQLSRKEGLKINLETRLYKSGDLARYLPDGHLEFQGRLDNQVKIRGFRVELGEIENLLAQHPKIQAVTVAAKGKTLDKQLVAYVVPKVSSTALSVPDERELNLELVTELKEFLKQKLPAYMLPNRWVKLSELPLSPNGKIDYQSLPEPTVKVQISRALPGDDLEAKLLVIWQKILNLDNFGVDDNFFTLGGNSLLGMSLLDQIEKNFGKTLPLITVFQFPTIRDLSKRVRQETQTHLRTLEVIQPVGQRLPFFFVGSTRYARAISPYLSPDQPVYGLNIFGLQQPENIEINLQVSDIARQYLQEVQTVQPKGPYHLGGYCGDAIIAFEMAQQLLASGQTVGMLAFIDVVWQPQNHYARHWHNLLEFGPGYLGHKLMGKLRHFKLIGRLTWGQWQQHFYQSTGILPRKLHDTLFIRAFYQALECYEPQAYAGKITLFLSKEWYWRYSSALEKIALGGVEMQQIHAYHDNLFIGPQVESLARALQKSLDNIAN